MHLIWKNCSPSVMVYTRCLPKSSSAHMQGFWKRTGPWGWCSRAAFMWWGLVTGGHWSWVLQGLSSPHAPSFSLFWFPWQEELSSTTPLCCAVSPLELAKHRVKCEPTWTSPSSCWYQALHLNDKKVTYTKVHCAVLFSSQALAIHSFLALDHHKAMQELSFG